MGISFIYPKTKEKACHTGKHSDSLSFKTLHRPDKTQLGLTHILILEQMRTEHTVGGVMFLSIMTEDQVKRGQWELLSKKIISTASAKCIEQSGMCRD